MRLILLRSLWTTGFNLEAALADVATGGFDGIEGPLPSEPAARRPFLHRLQTARVPFVAELVTGGGYVPTERSIAAHLTDLVRGLDAAAEASPRFVTLLAGCDAWPASAVIEFFGRALEIATARGIRLSVETHRSRPTFNPWATAKLLRQLPGLRLTCDFSHWCAVCERLVLDEEPGLLVFFAQHAHHIHARVGFAQGPQVPDPAAPEYATALAAHERWWNAIIETRAAHGAGELTITPEFGPDGYLHTLPFSGKPVADLDEINRWMARRLRERFAVNAGVQVPGGVL